MSRGLTLLLCTFTLVVGCSRDPETVFGDIADRDVSAGAGSLLVPTSVSPGQV